MLRVVTALQVNGTQPARVEGMEVFRTSLDEAKAGDNIGLLFASFDKSQLPPGAVPHLAARRSSCEFEFALITTGDVRWRAAYRRLP